MTRRGIGLQIGWLAAWLAMVVLAGCDTGASSTTSATRGTNTTSVATSTPDPLAPTPVATAGLPCQGGEWGNIITSAGAGVPLPPLTVSGVAEHIPSGNWTGYYLSLCTGGTIDGINTFTSNHMSELGWSYEPPPGDCICNGENVWSKASDSRLVQFESHPHEFGGHVVWGVTIYTHN